AHDDEGISVRRVSTAYHQALGIPLRQGRLFEAADRTGSPDVVIINEAAARQYLPGQDPIGQSVKLNEKDRTIVGVVGDVHQTSLETAPMAEVYVPMGQLRVLNGELIVKTSGNPYDVLPAVRAAVLAALPDVPL